MDKEGAERLSDEEIAACTTAGAISQEDLHDALVIAGRVNARDRVAGVELAKTVPGGAHPARTTTSA